MSHIAKVATDITNRACLKKALENLGIGYQEAGAGEALKVKGYGKGEEIADCIMEIKSGCAYGIGESGGKLELVADWWAIETFSGENQEEIARKIRRRYAYESVMDKVRDMGYSVVEEAEDAKQRIRLTVRRWG
jgi:hypothetical protein